MNTIVTSKEAILRTSRQLIQQQGWNAVNIRAVAKACDISVGSIYNYFGSKSELVAATVESVWCDIFHFPENGGAFGSFPSCVEWAFARMREGEEKYPGFFTLHSMSFVGADRSDGQQRMAQSWRSVTAQLRLLWYFGHDPKGAVLTPVRRGFSERKMNTVHQSRQTGGASSKK